ncbi:MAG: M23 family metallopeptidase [Flavobacteriaceae bacterium]|nr:M23 family metallopeptidase [Flavobacteriaceae bacterium]
MNKTAISAFIFFLSTVANAQLKLVTPIDGQYLKDYFIVNYVDLDTAKGSMHDINCGIKTYDGHAGIDFALKNFKQMDSGVTVKAAAGGRVVAVTDSAFDRSKSVNGLGFANYICIKHLGGYYTYYAHLRKGSANVKLNDSVTEGQAIAFVGSAGNSTDPHLHFEIWYQSSYYFEPSQGTCQTYPSFWKNQLNYDTAYRFMDNGLINFIPSLDTLKERPLSQTIFNANDSFVSFWTHYAGAKSGDSIRIDWIDPQGALYFSFKYTENYTYWYYYWFSYIYKPKKGGQYFAKLYINGQLTNSTPFFVTYPTSISESEQAKPAVFCNGKDFMIQTPTEMRQTQLSLYDSQGRKVFYDCQAAGKQFSMKSEGLAKGVYMLQLKDELVEYTIPLVVGF